MDQSKETRAYVLDMLKLDHKKIIDLFFQFDQSNDPRHKASFAITALNELAIHSHLEEEIFYQYVRAKKPGIANLIERCEQQHGTVDSLIRELDFENIDEAFEHRFFEIVSEVKSHIQFEEKEIMLQLDDVDLGAIATILEIRKNELLVAEAAGNQSDFTPQTAIFKQLDQGNHPGAQA